MRLIHTSLFFKIFKMWCRLLKFSENRQNFFLLDNCIRIGYDKFPLLQTEYVSSAVNVSTDSLTISDISKRDVLISLVVMKWEIKVLLCRFRQYSGPFNMLTAEECSSKMGLFRHLSNQVLRCLQCHKNSCF